MNVSVDDSRCHGHQMCAIASPEVFGSDEYGNAVVLLDPVPVHLEASVRRAEANCPERAITIDETKAPDETKTPDERGSA